jgi:3',5'-cyclic AMP phosphodiesterase CpdA
MKRAIACLALAVSSLFGADDFWFLQMSDPQFGMAAKDAEFGYETLNYEYAIAQANRLKPQFVIVTGDLVNKAGDAAQIAEYKRITAKLDRSIRVYSVPGNHDVGNEPTPETLARYREQFGPDYYSFQEGPVYGIVLNSVLIHSPQKAGDAPAQQEKWLRQELAKARQSGAGRHIVVFLHHPIFVENPGEPDQYFNLPAERRAALLELLEQHGVRYVFAGHHHRNGAGTDRSLAMTTTGPVGPALGGDRSGFRAIRVSATGIDHRYLEFGQMPASLSVAIPSPRK